MPSELRPNWKRKFTGKDGHSKIIKIVNLEETLKVLEQKEKNRKGDDADATKNEDNNSDDVIFRVKSIDELQIFLIILYNFQEEVEPEEQDDEMDEDNDYGHNYFDNGENYNDEDDNLNDEPTY